MKRAIPTISMYMTITPHTARPSMSLDEAMKLMRERHIRHLPILDGGRLVGMLSEGDIRLLESAADAGPMTAEEAMVQDVYVVSPSTPLDEVAEKMASKKCGSAVVMQNQKLVGIFTVVDALFALSKLLQTNDVTTESSAGA